MKILSIQQPWAWLILYGGKDIENRSWPTRFRGRFLVHASKRLDKDTFEDLQHLLPPIEEIQCGGIVGSVELTDCVEESDSPWFFGRYGFVLRNPEALPFQPLKGSLGFFDDPRLLQTYSQPARSINNFQETKDDRPSERQLRLFL